MDERGAPLTMTKTLGPAIAFVAETAGGLIKEGEEQRRRIKEEREAEPPQPKNAERETVMWVLASPERLEKLLAEEKQSEAEKDWKEVQRLLDAWGEVKGVAEVRAACEKVMEKSSNDD